MDEKELVIEQKLKRDDTELSGLGLVGSEPFRLIDEMAPEQLLETLGIRSKVLDLIRQGDVQSLVLMGFPEDMAQVMVHYSSDMPDILISISHPSQLDLYRTVGMLNCWLLISRLSGYNIRRVKVPYYDTVRLDSKSVLNPFLLKKGNFWGLRGKTTDDPIDIDAMLSKMGESIQMEIIDELFNQIFPFVSKEIKKLGVVSQERGVLMERVKSLMSSRMQGIISFINSCRGGQVYTIGEFLVSFQQRLISDVIGEQDVLLEDILGYDCPLLASADTVFRDTARMYLEHMVCQRGEENFISMFPDGDLSIVCVGGSKCILVKCHDGTFMLKGYNSGSLPSIVPRGKGVELLLSSQRFLARSEMVSIILSGTILHMGSEYGVRDDIVKKLGISGEAERYVRNLRIGSDNRHASSCMAIEGVSDGYLSLPFLYVMLGKEGILSLIRSKVGKTCEADVLDMDNLRTFFARSLLRDA